MQTILREYYRKGRLSEEKMLFKLNKPQTYRHSTTAEVLNHDHKESPMSNRTVGRMS